MVTRRDDPMVAAAQKTAADALVALAEVLAHRGMNKDAEKRAKDAERRYIDALAAGAEQSVISNSLAKATRIKLGAIGPVVIGKRG